MRPIHNTQKKKKKMHPAGLELTTFLLLAWHLTLYAFFYIFYLHLFFPGEVIKHDDIKVVLNEGMPLHKNPFEKGRLIIHFAVKFPESNFLPEPELKKLETLLPKKEECIITDEMEEVTLTDYTKNHQAQSNYRNAYDEDEDDHRGHGGVQCQTH